MKYEFCPQPQMIPFIIIIIIINVGVRVSLLVS
jgi:hypothetical protein